MLKSGLRPKFNLTWDLRLSLSESLKSFRCLQIKYTSVFIGVNLIVMNCLWNTRVITYLYKFFGTCRNLVRFYVSHSVSLFDGGAPVVVWFCTFEDIRFYCHYQVRCFVMDQSLYIYSFNALNVNVSLYLLANFNESCCKCPPPLALAKYELSGTGSRSLVLVKSLEFLFIFSIYFFYLRYGHRSLLGIVQNSCVLLKLKPS